MFSLSECWIERRTTKKEKEKRKYIKKCSEVKTRSWLLILSEGVEVNHFTAVFSLSRKHGP